MKNIQPLTTICLFLLVACSNNTKNNKQDAATLPEAMQESKSTYLSKRPNTDPVNTIYQNIIEKSPELKNIDEQTRNLASEKADSTKAVSEYLHQMNNYYASARQHLNNIQDSVLRQKIIEVLTFSMNNFDKNFTPYRISLDSIEKNIQSINDRREVWKVVLTLPVINDYEQKNKPSIVPLNKLNGDLEKRRSIIDSAITKR